jgi:putative endonuclease
MMRDRAGKHNKVGATGELIARKWLINNGFSIIADNYQKKWGEIDIIAKKQGIVHFVEVKAVSYETKAELQRRRYGWRPEDNVHPHKLLKMQRTISTWLIDNPEVEEWQIDVIAVRLVAAERYATVVYIENVIQ